MGRKTRLQCPRMPKEAAMNYNETRREELGIMYYFHQFINAQKGQGTLRP